MGRNMTLGCVIRGKALFTKGGGGGGSRHARTSICAERHPTNTQKNKFKGPLQKTETFFPFPGFSDFRGGGTQERMGALRKLELS